MVAQTNGFSNGDAHLLHPNRITPELVCSSLMEASRRGLIGNLQSMTPLLSRQFQGDARPRIDIPSECGYLGDEELTPDFMRQVYTRWGLAARVVNIWPDECFAVHPDIYQNETDKSTPFERRLESLITDQLLYHHIHRADKLSRISRFGIMFLGLDDGRDLAEAPPGINPKTGENKNNKEHGLNYIRAFDEALIRVSDIDRDQSSARFGEPTLYNISFTADQKNESPLAVLKDVNVHWTRVQHIHDNQLTSAVNGESSMKPVMDYLIDTRKILGGAGEMFWKGGFPGYSFETYPDLAGQMNIGLDENSLRSQMQAYQLGLQRFLANVGGSWKSLAPQVADPGSHLQWNINMICMTLGVPTRIFMGSESGQLASTKDDDHWRRRVIGRQTNYLEPCVVRPMFAKLMNLGVLPRVKKYIINWRDLRALSEEEKADIALKKVQALSQYTTGDVNQVLPIRILLTHVLGFTEEVADIIEKSLIDNPPAPPVAVQQMAQDKQLGMEKIKASKETAKFRSAGRLGNVSRGKVGKPKGSKPKGEPRPRRPAGSQRNPSGKK